MITSAFSIFDSKSKVFQMPFFMLNSDQAVRAFGDAVNSPESTVISRHPEDFQLYQIGIYDDATATLTQLTPLQMLATGTSLVKILNPKRNINLDALIGDSHEVGNEAQLLSGSES